MLDIERVRSDTTGCEATIHFNHAGCSMPPDAVVEAMVEFLQTEARVGGYETAADRVDQLDAMYASSARLLGCSSEEIAFVAGAGEAWWRAFLAVPLQPGDRMLMGPGEYQANMFAALQARDRGVIVDLVPTDEAGLIDVEALAEMLDERVRLVTLTMVAMTNGAVQPAAAVGAAVADHPAVYLLDACQAAGQMRVDVDEIGCDFAVYTGRKWMRGPRGTGVLYARSSVLDGLGPQPMIDGRSAVWTDLDSYRLVEGARRFESSEQHFAGRIGLDVATRYLLDLGVDAVAERVTSLAERFRSGLSSVPEVELRDTGGPRSGIVSFTVQGGASAAQGEWLRNRGVQLSVPARTMSQADIGVRGIDAVFRAGVHYVNTEAEVDRAVEIVAGLAAA